MNEVEKLYSNCGIENYRLENFSGFVPDGYIIIDDENREGYVKEIVREFTAEKQLELIKWLIKEVDTLQMWYFSHKHDCYDFDLGSRNSTAETFEECIARVINTLWQDLTDAERKQIREILE